MNGSDTTEITIIRHAPTRSPGRLCGRTDVRANTDGDMRIARMARDLPVPARLIASPARRCIETAAALWPGRRPDALENSLWEQDFGEWEGLAYADLPDLGPQSLDYLASHRPPKGESFADMAHRVAPVLQTLARQGDTTVVAHAGTVRAAIALANGSLASALSYEIAHLSMTRLRAAPDGRWSIVFVNRTADIG
ncbi:MAG: histidine phosphatase family protein [Rhodobacteraceae bacterium]|nr:histidine phosphatase family protein [Paracoccaceae bacterium]